ncbi:LexA family protein [Agrobacterium tumefaciens]|uniref:Transcriptional regulator n=1 Tax=Agrobacterium tumefaciens TaxID=358 RepID=A0A2L2LCA7_AGRTU|nr:S24 family peptidase [Agrobacterium tumefaciens]AVH41858.1 transcriptional regulator [Agrobacterium tumefaciens]NSY95775.1 phage repressor protein [Agrobacterium tumefaciens]
MLEDVLARIDKRLKALGLAESSAATKAGLSDSAIRNMRRAVKSGKGRTAGASTKTIDKLAPVLRTTSAWLLDEIGPEEVTHVGHQGVITDVPRVSWVSAGQLVEQPGIDDFSNYPTEPAIDLPEGEWICLEVDGSSMNKISPPESLIFVNLRDKRLVPNGCYVVADESGSATYKRYRPNDDPPFQPASYEDIAPPVFQGTISVVGRVRRSVINM